jgi:hypothetical protein
MSSAIIIKPQNEKHELITALYTISEQNYLQFNGLIRKQNELLGMGSPNSA